MLITGTDACSRQLLDRSWCGPVRIGDRVDHAREHERGVTWRLAARELQLALAQHQRVAAQLVHPRLERDPRARGGLVEHERHALALERARGEPIGLELDRAVDEPLELVGRKLLAGQEMPRQIRVLSWNLYHGRDFPPDPALSTWRSRLLRITERNATHAQVNRSLLEEFGRVLNGFEWDVALLQEAPPRWFRRARPPHPIERPARAHLAQPVSAGPAPVGGPRTPT